MTRANVTALLKAAKAMPTVWGDLNECVYCRAIFMSRYGVVYKGSKHRRNCRWAVLQRAIRKIERANKP